MQSVGAPQTTLERDRVPWGGRKARQARPALALDRTNAEFASMSSGTPRSASPPLRHEPSDPLAGVELAAEPEKYLRGEGH